MGDRGNIVIEDSGERVYLYTHWKGSDIGLIVSKALARRQRWDDPPYLACIIFDELTDGQKSGETGYGISSRLGDNEHPVLVVDCAKQLVRFEDDEGKPTGGKSSFEEWAKKA
jgi:hypothetical protein